MKLKKITAKEVIDAYSLLATCLIPHPDDIEEYKKIKKGDVINVKIADIPRNYEHHKKLFGILNYSVSNSDFTGTDEDFLTAIKYEIGFVDVKKKIDDSEVIIPRSISFEKMGQKAFEDFYNKVMFCLSKYMNDSIEEIEQKSVLFARIKDK